MKLDGVLTVDDFTKMFNVNKNGEFSTSDVKTHGQLQLKNGKLVNVNRYDRGKSNGVENTGKATADNFLLRDALVKALRAEGASASFLEETRQQLGLKPNDETAKPLSRRQVKQILRDFKANGKTCKDKTDFPPKLIDSVELILSGAANSPHIMKFGLKGLATEVESFFNSVYAKTKNEGNSEEDTREFLKAMRTKNPDSDQYLKKLGSLDAENKDAARNSINEAFEYPKFDDGEHPIATNFLNALKEMLLDAVNGRLDADKVKQPVQEQPKINNNINQEDEVIEKPVDQPKAESGIVADEPKQIVRPQVKRPESFDFKVEQPSFFPISTNEFLTIVNEMDQKANQMLEDLSKLKFPCLKGKDYGTACSKRLEDFKDGISYLQNLLRSQRLGLATNRNINEAMMKDFQRESFERHEMYLLRISDFCVAELREFNELEEFNG